MFLLIALIAIVVLLGVLIILGAGLWISKAINGVFLGLFGNLYVLVKVFCIIKKIIIIGIIFKLLKREKVKKAENEDEKAD